MTTIERSLLQVLATVNGFKNGERGQGMAEYGLILALVAVVVIGALTAVGTGVSGTFNTIAGKV